MIVYYLGGGGGHYLLRGYNARVPENEIQKIQTSSLVLFFSVMTQKIRSS